MGKKISDLTAISGGTFATTDLFEISVDSGGGSFVSRKITGQEIIDSIPSTNIGNSNLTISSSGTRKLIMGGALSTDIFSIRNSGDTIGVFSIDGTGNISVKQNLTNNDRLYIGGNNTITTSDSVGYNDFAVVGYGNSGAGITHVFGSNNTTVLNTTDANGFVIGDNNDHQGKSIGILGHDNDGGRFVFGKGNYSRGILPMCMFGDSNLTTTTGNGFPNKPVYIIGDHNEIPNTANTGNSIHFGVRTTNGDPYTTVHENNFLIGTLNTWDTNYDMSARGVYYTKTGTAPTTIVADSFGMYSADEVAGNACPHFRTENGDIVKLYTESALTASDGTLANAVTRIGEIETALQNLGLLA